MPDPELDGAPLTAGAAVPTAAVPSCDRSLASYSARFEAFSKQSFAWVSSMSSRRATSAKSLRANDLTCAICFCAATWITSLRGSNRATPSSR